MSVEAAINDSNPATGSAAGSLGFYLVAQGRAPGKTWFTIQQGHEINRPSRIDLRVSGDRIDIAGRCAIVGQGTLAL